MPRNVGAPELRALSVGEVLDAAIKIYFRHARTLFLLVLLIVAPTQVLISLIDLSASEGIYSTGGEIDPAIDVEDVPRIAAGLIVIVLLTLLSATLATGACFKAIVDGYLGGQPSWRESLAFVARRLHSLVWVSILVYLLVVRTGGEPVGFLTSSIRNLMRLVDILPSFYVVGGISVLVSSRNQRLGDIAAGTLVVRERRGDAKLARLETTTTPAYDSATWDVSGVTAEELAIVRSFLHRRQTLDDGARSELARELAARLRPRVTGAFDELGDEVFLQRLAAAKAARV